MCYLPLILKDEIHEQIHKNNEKSSPSIINEVLSTSCGHCFHGYCLRIALKYQKKCPTCRKELKSNDFHPIYLAENDDYIHTVRKEDHFTALLLTHNSLRRESLVLNIIPHLQLSSSSLLDESCPGSAELAYCTERQREKIPTALNYEHQTRPPRRDIHADTLTLEPFLRSYSRQLEKFAADAKVVDNLKIELAKRQTQCLDAEHRAAIMHNQIQEYMEQEKKLLQINKDVNLSQIDNANEIRECNPILKRSLNVIRCSELSPSVPPLSLSNQTNTFGLYPKEQLTLWENKEIRSYGSFEYTVDKTRESIFKLQREIKRIRNECNKLLLEKVNLQRKVDKYKRHIKKHVNLDPIDFQPNKRPVQEVEPEYFTVIQNDDNPNHSTFADIQTIEPMSGQASALRKEVYAIRKRFQPRDQAPRRHNSISRKVHEWLINSDQMTSTKQ